MNYAHIHRICTRTVSLICLLLLVQPSLVAAQDITGEWEITMEFGGRPSYATLTISRNADGTLAGKWGSSDLSNVKFQDGKLTFVRTIKVRDQEFKMNYSGTLKDGKLTGLLSNERGKYATNGVRKKPLSPALGQWDMSYRIGKRDVTAKLVISEKPDGELDGKWVSERDGGVISNAKFRDGKLTFNRKSTLNNRTSDSTFEGTVNDNELTGAFKSQQGEMAATGKRIGSALIGTWELTVTSEQGTRTSIMTVHGDLGGRYEFFGGEIPMKDLRLEGNQVTFAIEMGFGDRVFKMDFKGTLDGNALKGQMASERGTSEVTGKKLVTATASAAPITSPSATSTVPSSVEAFELVKESGYELTRPAAWSRTTTLPQGFDAGFRKDLGEGREATLFLHHEIMPPEAADPPADTSDMVRQWNVMVKNMYPDARTVVGTAPKVTGKILINGNYELTDGGKKVRRRYTYFLSGRTAFVVQCSASPDRWAGVLTDFDNMMASLQPGGSAPEKEKKSDETARAEMKLNIPTLLDSFPTQWKSSLSDVAITPGSATDKRTLVINLSFTRTDIAQIYNATKTIFDMMKAGKSESDLDRLPPETQKAARNSSDFMKYVGQVSGLAWYYVANCSPAIERYTVQILDSGGRKVGSLSVSKEDMSAILTNKVTASEIQRIAAMYVFE